MDEKNMNYDKSDDQFTAEIKKRLEVKMKEQSIEPPEKSKAHKAAISTISFILGIPMFTLIFIGTLAYGAMCWGFVLTLFWKWFLLPVIPTLPQITFGQAIGLMMIVSLFDKNVPQVISVELTDNDKKNIFDLISPWLTLIVGWIVWFFVMPLF
jgi:hypothetical protein